jgi:ribosomal protein S18 acetylase RimI-like enzyme
MGCCTSKVSALEPLPPLHDGVCHLTADSPGQIRAQVEEMLALSWCGSTEQAPESGMSWCYDPQACGENVLGPLVAPPPVQRMMHFRFVIRFCVTQAIKHGGCFYLTDPDGKVVSAAICLPPSDKNIHDPGMCEMMSIINKLGSPPPSFSNKDFNRRDGAVRKVMTKMHKKHASGRHWYIYCMGTDPVSQGKGYGKRMMQWMSAVADNSRVPCYLECSGTRNEGFYGSFGFKVVGKEPIKAGQELFDANGGLVSMLRYPS